MTKEQEQAVENLRQKKLARKEKVNRPQTEYYPSKSNQVSVGESIPGFKPRQIGFPDKF